MTFTHLHKETWQEVAFRDIAKNVNKTVSSFSNTEISRYIGLEHLDSDTLKIDRWGNLNEGISFSKVFQAGQILFGKRRVYLRKVAIADFDGVCSGDILVFEPKIEKVDPSFFPFVVQSEMFFTYAIKTSAGSLSPRTKWKDLAEFQFHLPPLDEQCRIADMLFKIEAASAQTDQQAQAVRAYRKGLINHIFNQPDDVGMVLPKTQKTIVPFGKVAANLNESERNPLEKGMTRFIGLEHLEPEHLRITSWGNLADGTTFTKVFRQGQVLFGKRRAYLKKAARAEFDGICSGDILVFEAKADTLLPGLLPYLVQNEAFFQHAVTTSAGSLSPRTKWKDVANFEFYLPDMDRQQKLLDIFTQLEQALEQNKRHAAALTAFKKGLLNELIG